jgi:hypothetical protein
VTAAHRAAARPSLPVPRRFAFGLGCLVGTSFAGNSGGPVYAAPKFGVNCFLQIVDNPSVRR